MKRIFVFIALWMATLFAVTSCGANSDWARRDFPLDGLEIGVEYSLKGAANSDQQVNESRMRGVGDFAPQRMQLVEFRQMSGFKTEDVTVTLPNGQLAFSQNMGKLQRFAGLTKYLDMEVATYSGTDANGKTYCSTRVRLTFTRNLVQYADPNLRDYDTLWLYDEPCYKDGYDFVIQTDKATLRAVVLINVWQARIAARPFFWNWNQSATVVGGPAAALKPGWWVNWELTDGQDVKRAASLANEMIHDLDTSSLPWLEFNNDGPFKDATVIFSAGDADRYATWDRVLLNRQSSYAVMYRPDRTTSWDCINVTPIYNWEWNLAVQNLAALKGWGDDPLAGQLNEKGMPSDLANERVQALERVGWANAPNPALSQVRFNDCKSGYALYAITMRAFIGASDTLILYGKDAPPSVQSLKDQAPQLSQPRPLDYDANGNPVSEQDQTIKEGQWPEYLREMSLWKYVKDPRNFPADLKVQYRYKDSTKWAPVYCRDSDGDKYVCGYTPVEWNLNASYFTQGDAHKAWLISQLLGEVGVRTLGFSYVSAPWQGTGMNFALAQIVLRQKYISGYTSPEDLLVLDCRACVYPDTLRAAWDAVHNR